jgi:hypothetical protein
MPKAKDTFTHNKAKRPLGESLAPTGGQLNILEIAYAGV